MPVRVMMPVQYVEAAQRYLELSYTVPEGERMVALKNALTCTVLAPPGAIMPCADAICLVGSAVGR